MIADDHRGYLVELMATKLLSLEQDVQIVGMSATLSVSKPASLIDSTRKLIGLEHGTARKVAECKILPIEVQTHSHRRIPRMRQRHIQRSYHRLSTAYREPAHSIAAQPVQSPRMQDDRAVNASRTIQAQDQRRRIAGPRDGKGRLRSPGIL